MKETLQPELITAEAAFASLVERLASADSFAFDTEFVGEDKYEPQVCLIQVAIHDYCALIDPLAGVDLKPFWDLIVSPGVRKIVHAGSEDAGICYRQTGKMPSNILDLQIAAGMVGQGFPTSLAKLARATLGVTVHKSQTLTDWRRRPLTADQIEYAAADVAYLPRMADAIGRRLSARGREAWALEESAMMCDGMLATMNPENKRRRLRGGGALGRREWILAESLMDERDKLAREMNRPPRTVLRDHLLVEIARRGWTDPTKMAGLRGLNLPMSALKRLAKAIEDGRQKPVEAHSLKESNQDEPEEEILMSLLNAVLRDHCLRQELAYTLLVSRQDLRDYVRTFTREEAESTVVALREGWRSKAVGDLLDRLMRGEQAIRVNASDNPVGLKLE